MDTLHRALEDNEEIRIITPQEMTFLFEMGEGECHQRLTGTCSLERKRPDRSQDIGDECDYDYCPSLLRSLKKHGQIFRIDIIKHGCGHYGFNDGQHRTCIAKKKGLRLLALITSTPDFDCELCRQAPCEDCELR